jgi:hypothetical protein
MIFTANLSNVAEMNKLVVTKETCRHSSKHIFETYFWNIQAQLKTHFWNIFLKHSGTAQLAPKRIFEKVSSYLGNGDPSEVFKDKKMVKVTKSDIFCWFSISTTIIYFEDCVLTLHMYNPDKKYVEQFISKFCKNTFLFSCYPKYVNAYVCS